jgi:RNA polymerase sigma-70 factor (ECF subfamily)
MGMGSDELSDEDLLARLIDRDTDAFATLYDRHSRMAFGLAYRMLGDASAAEDVVQEAFLSVWRQADTFRPGRAAARTWLLSIVHHRAVDRLRRMDSREVVEATMDEPPDRADERTDVEQEVAALVEAQQVRSALGVLPPDQRRAIELAYFGGHSHGEIARMLGIPTGTVKSRLRIGLEKLRTVLQDVGFQGVAHDA